MLNKESKFVSILLIICTICSVLGIGYKFMGTALSKGRYNYEAIRHYEKTFDIKKDYSFSADLINTGIKIKPSYDRKAHIVADIKISSNTLKDVPSDYYSFKNSNELSVKEKSLKLMDASYNGHMEISLPAKLVRKATIDSINGSLEMHDLGCSGSLTTINGDIYAYNIDGNINSKAKNGKVKLRRISGKISSVAVNGDIELYEVMNNVVCEAQNGSESVNCINGDIDTVILHNFNGSIEVNGLNPTNSNLKLYTTNGSIELSDKFKNVVPKHFENSLEYKIGKGKKLIELRSKNGDVNLN